MVVFELVLALLLCGVGLTLLAPRLAIPSPVLLGLAGTLLAFVPGIPVIRLEPDLALALFVAPILLDAAYDASPRDLRDNWISVGGLVLVAVTLTVAGVAVTAHWMVPAMPWAAAVALGAIVAPPDAAAATAVLRQVRLPHRIMVILEGESLLNDASALLIYRFAVVSVAGGLTAWAGLLLVGAAVGGGVLGFVSARIYLAAAARVEEGPAAVLLQFLGTFGVWLLADAIGLSAILTIVAYAITIARLAPLRSSARQRRSSYAVWEVVVLALNILAFIMVGLQLRGIVARLGDDTAQYLLFAAAVLGVTIAVRFVWVMTHNTILRWKNRRFGSGMRRPMMLPNIQSGVVISWCGMRGIVTLAASLALPEAFPQRDLIVFTAFCVVLGTLVLQGLTLPPLLARLRLPADASVEEEVALARTEAAHAALGALQANRDSEAGRLLMREYETRLDSSATGRGRSNDLGSLRRQALAAERERLVHLRREERIGDDAFHLVEEELDWAEAEWQGSDRRPD